MAHSIIYPIIGQSFTILEEVESTNNYAMELARNGLSQHGDAWFAYFQTAGKGQRGKNWSGSSGQNIALSMLLDSSSFDLKQQFEMIVLSAVAAWDFFSQYAGDETTIKWPNDIYWNDRKACGILTESIVKGQKWQWTVVGIGVNVNQPKFEASLLKKAVSLRQITGKSFELVPLAREICSKMEGRWQQLLAHGFEHLLQTYNAHLYRRGQKARLQYENVIFDCVVERVDAQGNLWVQIDGQHQAFRFGEVQWIIE